MALALLLAACSRSGSLYGDVVVPTPPGVPSRAARLSIRAIPATPAFARGWAAALAAFQGELEPARHEEQAAAARLDRMRLAWDRAVAAPRSGRQPAPRGARARDLWQQVLGAGERLTQAKRQVWDVVRRYDQQAVALLDLQRGQVVQTDGTGHYVFAGLPAGPTYLYARLPEGAGSLLWFRRVQVQGGAQRVDLTETNAGGWPFVP